MKSSYRPAKARINLHAIKHNLHIAKKAAGSAEVLAVVKANAYGHGMEDVAIALQQEADQFGVASLDDVLRLRAAGIKQSITCLSGFYQADEARVLIQNNAVAVIYDEAQLESLRVYSSSSGTNDPIKVWLKIDTGMGRLGFQVEKAECLAIELEQLVGVELLGLLTHFSNSDDPLDVKNQQQFDDFMGCIKKVASGVDGLKSSASNSAALLSRSEGMFDLVRPGLMLYGASPISSKSAEELSLLPAMSFESELISVRDIKQGSTVGYGGAWMAPTDMRIGVVAIGYGDGYPRHAPTGTPVLVNGQRAQLIGRVSMDLISVDLTGIEAKVADKVVLWGNGLPVEEIAALSGTISYELLCGVTERVTRIYS